MYPTNQYMDPYYSHYRNHTPYSYYPPPGWEAGHPRAMDSSYRPPSYGPWLYNAGMHHPHPPEFHCCCNHSYPPAGYYAFRPPFPQELPPAHLYYHGPFPQHPNEYPSYFVRPHHYPVEQTPYDYNKFNSHCCGCPNHVCHGGEKSNVKVEEERPDGKPERELKDAGDSSIIRPPNNQYPVIWLPSGNIEDKENGKRYELPPQLLNGWVPVGSKRTEDAKQQGQDDQKEKQYQWPIVWMPEGYDEPKQKAKVLKEKDENPKITEETPPSPKIKIIPLSWLEDQKPAAKSGSRDHSDRSAVESQPATTEHRDGAAVEGHHTTTPIVPRRVNDERKPARENYRTIPVLPEKETGEKKLGTYRTIPVTTQKENDKKKPAVTENKEEKKASNAERPGENGKGHHSKLPPVCLRVDPLPRKKSGNGSSRSPSPPRKDAVKAKKDMNETQSQSLESRQPDTKKHTAVSEMKEKSSEEPKKGMGFSNETVLADSAKHSQEEEVPMSNDHQMVQASSTSVHAQENAGADTEGDGTEENAAGAEIFKGGDKGTDRDSETSITNLSETDAVVRIQSAYRGYDVRRWQPLDKLRKIRDVHEQMQGVRKQLQSLGAPSKKPTEKEQVAISEAIMNLLLKLDTIQGLLPCVREARKSVARELICLQEKLDSLCKQPSGGFNHTNEDERVDRGESIIHNAAPILTAEASDKEEKAVGLSEANQTSPGNSMELGDAVPSEVNMEVGQDSDPSGLQNQNEKSCTSTMEVPHEEGKTAEQVEFQGASTYMMSATALPEHPHDNHEHQIEESNAGSLEANEEEKKVAVADELRDMPLMDSIGPSHDAAPTVDSSGQEKCMASTGQSLHAEESNTGVSPAVTGDIKATTTTVSLDDGLAADNDVSAQDQTREAVGVERPELRHVSAQDQTREAVGVERPELRHDVSSAEETPDVTLEDPLVSLKDAEPHKHDPTTAADSVTSNVDEKPKEASDMNMLEQVADSTLDSTKEPDGTSEASMGLTSEEPAASEEPAQAALLEPTSEFDSISEQTVLEELNSGMQSELSGKVNAPHVDQKNEILELTGGEFDVQANHSVAEERDSRAKTVFRELDSSESSAGYERPEMTVSLKRQTAEQNEGVHSSCPDAQVLNTDERTETPKEAPTGVTGANSDVHVSRTEECNGTLDDSTICATGVTSAEVESDNRKEDVSVQTDGKASAEAFSAPVTPESVKDSDEKKLAEENQKLKALLQKLLASGNDQTEVITGLSEKVKVLERKLARKKKPKVRVHRPARHAAAKVH